MIPFFKKKSYELLLLSKLITLVNDAGHSDYQRSLLFYATFTVRYEIFLLHFLDTETLYQTNKIDDNSKVGSLIFVSCDDMHRDTGRPTENTENS